MLCDARRECCRGRTLAPFASQSLDERTRPPTVALADDQAELISSYACRTVVRTGDGSQSCRQRTNHVITNSRTVTVVHALEVVEVDERDRVSVTQRSNVLLEVPPIEEG